MGIIKAIGSAFLDEVGAIIPEVNEMRWNKMVKEYGKENESISYSSSNIKGKMIYTRIDNGIEKKQLHRDDNLPTISMEDFYNSVQESCFELCEKYPELFVASSLLRKKLGISGSEILFLGHDDTQNNEGSVGFMLTKKGLYCIDFLNKPVYICYEELACSIIKYDYAKGTASIGKTKIVYMMPTRIAGQEETRREAFLEIERMLEEISKQYAQIFRN